MHRYTIYRTPNLPNTYLVLLTEDDPRKLVPFNLLYLAGTPEPTKMDISPSYFPFAPGSRKTITETVEQSGYCFYRWPGRVLGAELGDVLEVIPEAESASSPEAPTKASPDA